MTIASPAEIQAAGQEPKVVNFDLVKFITTQFTELLLLRAKKAPHNTDAPRTWTVTASTYEKKELTEYEQHTIIKECENAGWEKVKLKLEHNPYAPIIYYNLEVTSPASSND